MRTNYLKKIGKALQFLAADPRYRGLQTHWNRWFSPTPKIRLKKCSGLILDRENMPIAYSGCVGLTGNKLWLSDWNPILKVLKVGLMIVSSFRICQKRNKIKIGVFEQIDIYKICWVLKFLTYLNFNIKRPCYPFSLCMYQITLP